MIEEIEKYLTEILKVQLDKIGLHNNENILESIRIRMYSLLKSWNDIEYRNTIFLFSSEEANFYQPVCKDEIRNFIVTTIRNSLIESAGSKFYYKYNYEIQITHDNIIEITKKAILYFKTISFQTMSTKIENKIINDYYRNITNRYELSWKVLTKLANMKKKKCILKKYYLRKKR